MSVASSQLFVRRTSLEAYEYRKNFRQIDHDVIGVLISKAACKVTPHMSRVYLALIDAPPEFWERQGVLRLAGRERKNKWQTAWEQLLELLGVASATARKALAWMSAQGIIGYFAGRNGVGIRIFINRAASSIGRKPDHAQKNLHLIATSSDAPPTSTDEVCFKESFAILEDSEKELNPHAPENGAAVSNPVGERLDPDSVPAESLLPVARSTPPASFSNHSANVADYATVVEQLRREIGRQVRSVTAQEYERTREWFISHALPKAIRVAQRSSYDVLRAHGLINETGSVRNSCDSRRVGKHTPKEITPRLQSDEEIKELAESCVALLVRQGKSIDQTISEMKVEAGGFLLEEDARKIRARAEIMTDAGKVNKN
jgi:hypothetical protein